MKASIALAVAIVLMLAGSGHTQTIPTAAGFWEALDDEGKPQGWFLFAERSGVFSARLVKGILKPGEQLQLVCSKCPGDRKGARLMGLTMFFGLKRDGLSYSSGHVIDPRDGKVYNAKMDLSEDGRTLKVRGYWGLSIAGKTATWKRLPNDAMKEKDIPREILATDPAMSTQAVKP